MCPDAPIVSYLCRHHSYKKVEGKIELSEIGPRFEMKGINIAKIVIKSSFSAFMNQKSFIHLVYEIRLGTIDQSEADVEWRLKPYMNTAKKRKFLE